ncbi:MAG: hypothetical protein IPJ34_05355 [Myxococcales bacterium]|nr:hypothetical protein [Myxococcales bacterium]
MDPCDIPPSCTKDGILAVCKCGGVDVTVACCTDGAVVVSPCMDGIYARAYCNPIRVDTGLDAVDTSTDATLEAGDGGDRVGDVAGDGTSDGKDG